MTRRPPHVAYFCMEYGLHESFPIYSGGLGILAGDFVKAARDLQLPMVAVGLLWARGYCVQRIGADGRPYEEFPGFDAGFLKDTGVRVRVLVRGVEVSCRVWVTERFGHIPLFLVDPIRHEDRWITHRLYEAGTDTRIAQEMLLGIGGVRALAWLGYPIATYHFNEGHAVFAGLEMIAERMESGTPFPQAWDEVRQHIVFTTHTPVRAGNEEHQIKDLRRMGACLQLSGAEMRAIGGDPFNMTVAGLRLARAANAVSQLHGETARAMWAGVASAAPIGAITNGVHQGTWQAPEIRAAGHDPDAVWNAHLACRRALGAEIERRSGVRLPDDAFVIGFARRAASYKRSDLLLRDEPRLERLFADPRVHVAFAGKAHPDDATGRNIVARLVQGAREHEGRVFFLENYDMALGRLLTRGCDVWLNNPIRPLEASGTSGMKAAMNGVLNVSILDGWWPEACEDGVNGFAIGAAEPGDDARDLEALYATLEQRVLPAWDDPKRWRRMMIASIEMAVERFSAERMLRQYFTQLYGLEPTKAGA
ncbi:MAG TPA: alpha-glucan family phosphorylase [Candidatus Acidoferrales bacterium]|nr:alpha-glucan family phosphorylase [Candidatus Acidoferrales bacterium]